MITQRYMRLSGELAHVTLLLREFSAFPFDGPEREELIRIGRDISGLIQQEVKDNMPEAEVISMQDVYENLVQRYPRENAQ